jgi:hypothetical protein
MLFLFEILTTSIEYGKVCFASQETAMRIHCTICDNALSNNDVARQLGAKILGSYFSVFYSPNAIPGDAMAEIATRENLRCPHCGNLPVWVDKVLPSHRKAG